MKMGSIESRKAGSTLADITPAWLDDLYNAPSSPS